MYQAMFYAAFFACLWVIIRACYLAYLRVGRDRLEDERYQAETALIYSQAIGKMPEPATPTPVTPTPKDHERIVKREAIHDVMRKMAEKGIKKTKIGEIIYGKKGGMQNQLVQSVIDRQSFHNPDPWKEERKEQG